VVTWYGAMLRSRTEGEVPRMVFWFYELDHHGCLRGPSETVPLAMSYLGQLRIGSIWRDGRSTEQLQFTRRELKCMYTQKHWLTTTSASEYHRESTRWLIPADDYKLHYGKADRSRLLRFQSGGKNFLIPCQEYFARCYARAEEINRILITYDQDEIRKRLLLEEPIDTSADEWQVWLPREATGWDSVLLAYLRHDHRTWLNVMKIKAEYDQQLFGPSQNGVAFMPIGPWFFGEAQLEVEGIPLSTGEFLGLRITGYSLPDERRIVGLRDQRETSDDENIGKFPVPRNNVIEISEGQTAPTTERAAPDRDTEIHQFQDPAIRLMGAQPRLRIQRVPRSSRGTIRVPPSKSEASASGEASGTGKGLARTRFVSAMKLDSWGAVDDLWTALHYLQEHNKDVLLELNCFDASHGFPTPPSKVLTYVELPEVERDTPKLNRAQYLWLNKDSLPGRRGVCIVRVTTPTVVGYIFEVQRAHVKRTVETTQTLVEESYCGLAVVPPIGANTREWMAQVMTSIVKSLGIMRDALKDIPSLYGEDYQRSFRKSDVKTGQATATNALERLGIQDLQQGAPKKNQGHE